MWPRGTSETSGSFKLERSIRFSSCHKVGQIPDLAAYARLGRSSDSGGLPRPMPRVKYFDYVRILVDPKGGGLAQLCATTYAAHPPRLSARGDSAGDINRPAVREGGLCCGSFTHPFAKNAKGWGAQACFSISSMT